MVDIFLYLLVKTAHADTGKDRGIVRQVGFGITEGGFKNFRKQESANGFKN
jgi:hypothetical protein